MSLINDALKKAQRQRAEEGSTTPAEISSSTGTTELHRVARREKPAGFRSQLVLLGGGAAAVILVLVVGALFLFRSDEPQIPAAPVAPPAAQVATAPAEATPAPATPSVAAPAPATAALPTPTATPAAVPAPAAAQPEVVATAVPAPAAPAASAPQFVLSPPPPAPTESSAIAPASATAPAERPKPSTRMIGVIEHFRVGGIRVSGTESKVLMNDKVYRLNDTVDYELGIRLTGIETKALTFEDSRGAVHVRTF